MSLIDDQITQCYKYIKHIDGREFEIYKNEISDFVYRIMNLYLKDIPTIVSCRYGVDYKQSSGSRESLMALVDFLRKYQEDITFNKRSSHSKPRLEPNVININNNQTQTNTQSQNVSIKISLEQAIDIVHKIPDVLLTDDEKDDLVGTLTALEKASGDKEKEKVWDKAKKILGYIADKGIDTGIALLPLLPFIQHAMENINL